MRKLVFAAALSAGVIASAPVFAQDGFGGGARESNGPGCNLFPAPASVGARVGLSYFGPPPSDSNPSLVGPVQLLKSGQLDAVNGRITLPLYKGYMEGTNTPVWYILTDVTDQGQAIALGLNYSAKLQYAYRGSRLARLGPDNNLYFYKGTVDFSGHRVVTGNPPNYFPPTNAIPGSVGDANYSPYVKVINQAGTPVYNAPIVAFGNRPSEINFPRGNVDHSKVHDAVYAIDPFKQTVTLNLVNGFSFGRPVWYLSMDSSDFGTAAVEGATYAPLMQKLPVGGDDSFSSPVERIFVNTNGPLDCNDPRRQGLGSAIADGFRPNNTLGGIPTIATDYSPAWDVNFWEWTPAALASGYRQQLREEFQILTYVQDGLLTGQGGKPFGSTGIINNCPIVERLN